MPTADPRDESILTIDLVAIDEENRQIGPSQTAMPAAGWEPAPEPPCPRRCDDAHREFLRNRFPRA